MFIKYKDKFPNVDNSCYIASGAYIIGDVTIGAKSSVWFNAIIRGDVDYIRIGTHTNIQDCAVIHTSRYNGPVAIGDRVTVGHSAVIHACTIGNDVVVGMKSLVMDKVIIEDYGFVAAGALIPPGKIVRSYELWAGVPAKCLRKINEEEMKFISEASSNYVELLQIYKAQN